MIYKVFFLVASMLINTQLVFATNDIDDRSDFTKLTIIKTHDLINSSRECSICLDELTKEDQDHEDLVMVCGQLQTDQHKDLLKEDPPYTDIERALIENIEKEPSLHILHKKCIRDWIALNPNCPICRAYIAFDSTYESLVKNVPNGKIRNRSEWASRIGIGVAVESEQELELERLAHGADLEDVIIPSLSGAQVRCGA